MVMMIYCYGDDDGVAQLDRYTLVLETSESEVELKQDHSTKATVISR